MDFVCNECSSKFQGSKKMYVPLAYCKPCWKNHSKDILELITANDVHVYTDSMVESAEKALMNLPSTELRLDLHKTLDTVSIDTQLPDSACCVSYVGHLTSTRIEARQEIQERIQSGQLAFGALVFARGSRKDKSRVFTKVGSKAWFNSLLEGSNPIFIDDSDDHVLSVEHIGIESIQLFSDQDLLTVLGAAMYRAISSSSDDDSLFR